MTLYLVLAALLVGADQFIKLWAQEVLKPAVFIDLIPGVFSLYYHENFGAAWGILQGKRWLLLAVTGVIIGGLLAALVMKKFKDPLLQTAVTLIVAGGIGNLIDRVFHAGGFVVDYLYFELINFPIFNLADMCVCIGTGLLAIYILFLEGKEKKLSDTPPGEGEPLTPEPRDESEPREEAGDPPCES